MAELYEAARRFKDVIPQDWRLSFSSATYLEQVLCMSALSGIDPNRLMVDSRTVKSVELVDAHLLVLACGSALGRHFVLEAMLDNAGISMAAFEEYCLQHDPPLRSIYMEHNELRRAVVALSGAPAAAAAPAAPAAPGGCLPHTGL